MNSPHYQRLILDDDRKDFDKNLEWRQEIFANGAEPEFRRMFWQACKEDILLFCNSVLWTYNPRDYPDQPHRPFITWDFQDRAILDILEAIRGRQDVVIKKSRQLGATWLCLLPILWRWQFYPAQTFLLVSRNDDYVDKTDEPKSLFWKLDYLHNGWHGGPAQPRWLLPATRRMSRDQDPNRTKKHLLNSDNGSVIDGEATSKNIARGAVYTAIMMDENAFQEGAGEIDKATRNATHTRIRNSTPNGDIGIGEPFYNAAHNEGNRLITMHWTDHPEKNRGLYRVRNNRIEVVDPLNPLPEGYEIECLPIHERLKERGFPIEGTTRSPYYDQQCERAASPAEIAQEEDIDFSSQEFPVFAKGLVDRIKREMVCQPRYTGTLRFDTNPKNDGELKHEFEFDAGGAWWVWCFIDARGKVPRNTQYAIGVDVAAGTDGSHSSNSAIEVFCRDTGEQVAEYMSPGIRPDQLARLTIACARWFSGFDGEPALVVPEVNGPLGTTYLNEIEDQGYSHIVYRRTPKDEGKRGAKKSAKLGWWSTTNDKTQIMYDLEAALREGRATCKSERLLKELPQFIYLNGKVVHQASTTDNPTSTGEAHGDLGIAAACANKGVKSAPVEKAEKEVIEYPRHSAGWRLNQGDLRRERAKGKEVCRF